MMICPQTKAECGYSCSAGGYCFLLGNQAPPQTETPPPPTLAEIERLADEHAYAVASYDRYGTPSDRQRMQDKRAALIAAYQRLGVK